MEAWRGADGKAVRTCSIITTSANETMAPVHHRMPVVLPAAVWGEWLRPQPLSADRLGQILAPAPADLLVGYPVGTGVNNSNRDGPELIFPVKAAAGPALLPLPGIWAGDVPSGGT